LAVYQIVYTSIASKKMFKSDLYTILRQARNNNNSNGVTGMLAYTEQNFFQVIEGNKEVVSELFTKIHNDNRHHDARILYENEVYMRSFANWEMAYVSLSARELANWAGLGSATTIEDTLNKLQSEKDLVTELVENFLKNSSLS